jgi:hypothetical protein
MLRLVETSKSPTFLSIPLVCGSARGWEIRPLYLSSMTTESRSEIEGGDLAEAGTEVATWYG